MRHRKKFNHLGRKVGHRRALLANMASSLILHKRIKTTTAKAKALRVYVEPLITKTKGLSTVEEKTHAQRVVFGHLQNKHAVKELFDDVASKVETRPGGYTRILKLGNRPGDNADMCFIELVDYNENMLTTKEAKKTTRRSRRGGKKKSDAPQAAESTDQSTESEEPTQSTATAQSEITDAEVVDTQEEAEASTQAEKSEPEAENATEEKAQSTESDTSKEEDTQSTEEGDKKEDNTDKSEGEEDNKSKE